jgi:dihydrofolate reductase
MKNNISIIVAMDRNRLIGKENGMPWHLRDDLKRFKNLTSGHTVIMGRKTFESIGKPLPNRRNIVITSRQDFQPTGVEVVHSIEDALKQADKNHENFVIGGADIYEQFLPISNKLYLTFVEGQFDGDTWFPAFSSKQWELIEETFPENYDQLPDKFIFKTYIRVK